VIVKRSSRIARGIVAVAIGASGPASAELKTFVLAWTSPGSGIARGTLTLDDEVCNNPGVNNLAGPAGCFVELTFTVSGDIKGKGTYTLDDMQDVNLQSGVALDFDQEVIAQGPTDVNFFSNGQGPGGVDPFKMAASDPDPEDVLTLVSMRPLPFPLPADAAKCSAAVGKAGAVYYSAKHKALHACRTAFGKGTPLFADKAKTVPILVAGECAAEFKTSARIAKARTRLRGSVAKKCTDAVLATIPACAPTVDQIANPTAATGCLLETVDFHVEKVIRAEFGF
jgi:hypothetical protein